jgi:hypothetical protein
MQNRSLKPRIAALLLAGLSSGLLVGAVNGIGYSDAVVADKPLAYYRFNDFTQRSNINLNSGSLGAAGNATNLNLHLFSGAIVGSRNSSAYFDSTARTIVPFNPALNPNETNSFTIEAWFYPTSDKVAGSFPGPAPINNRYSYSGVDRQGWVYFQRNPDASYASDGQTDVGWNFRMYYASGSSVGVQVTSQVPYRLGQWQHVVTVWDGPQKTAIIYIDGQPAATNTWSGDGQGYVANTADHPASEAVNGPAGLCFGSYNNTQPGDDPFRGSVDEVAFYSKTLTGAQILAHYQNATNAARSTPYETLINSDGPVGYWRLDDPLAGPDVAVNMGQLQNTGMATNIGQILHPASGGVNHPNNSSFGYHWRNSGKATTDMPWIADNNPDANVPFTLEAWFQPLNDQQNPGPAPINNRLAGNAVNRTGWVIYQRAPNSSYSGVSGYEGVGWTCRMYTGSGHGGQDVVSNVPYNVGDWQHVVFTWDGTNTGTMFINGTNAASNNGMTYVANTNPPADPDSSLTAADFAIGSYNAASGFGEEFEGNVDEVALYTNVVLSADQILAHYQAGTNSHPATNYATLVLTSPYDGAGTQGLQPVTYFRLNDPAINPAVNSGSLGDAAIGSILGTANTAAGPQPPTFTGFESGNLAVPLDGKVNWVSLNNPPSLNVSGKITLEAWIKPSATQSQTARIISHGPITASGYTSDMVDTNGVLASPSEVFLALQNSGGTYAVGTSDGTNFHGATFAVPAGDLGGSQWIHLAGSYDGANWTLFRNGKQVATAADKVGALPVPDADWATGGTGFGWDDLFTGSIDEVGIYDHALTADRIQAHYTAATSIAALPSLGITRTADGKITITWTTGTLQSSALVTGGFKDVAGATSPYTVPVSGSAQFFILRQ